MIIYVVVIAAVVTMVVAGFEPGLAIGLAAACGIVAADVAMRLLSDGPPYGEAS